MKIKLFISFLIFLSLANLQTVSAMDKGIYLTSYTAENLKTLNYLIKQAKSTGISTFVVDVDNVTKRYSNNVPQISNNGLRYIARIVIFPDGATPEQIKSKAYLEKRWKQIEYALSLGASAIQLDYIRYKSHDHAPSLKNQKDVYGAISYFKQKLKAKNKNIPLQADVFGIIGYKPEIGIGQDVGDIARTVDSINPMVYPSHFYPPDIHSATPYLTVNNAITRFKARLVNYPNVKIHAFIEVHNYRYRMSDSKNIKYILAEIEGARDSGVDGWYFWSAHNQYDLLFKALKSNRVDTMHYNFKTSEMLKLGNKHNVKPRT